jgi:hypothetical protein
LERKEKTSTFASAFEKEARLKKPDKEAIFEEMRYTNSSTRKQAMHRQTINGMI